ncbi:MAG: response regulator [Actinomycetota bacterium]
MNVDPSAGPMAGASGPVEAARPDVILVADDEVDMVTLIASILEAEGFQVLEAHDGERALYLAREHQPDLILLDVMMPRMDGLEVCRRLRANLRTVGIPVMLVSARAGINDRVTGLGTGANDYIIKPFDPFEMAARVKSTLLRAREMAAMSPLTHLPGNKQILQEITRRIEHGAKFAAMHLDIDNFKAYNDSYGFARGDEAIKLLAACALGALDEYSSEESLLGHIGGDDFMALTSADAGEVVAKKIVDSWDRQLPELCDPDDVARGYLEVTDRLKNVHRVPLVTLSIGLVTNITRPVKTHWEVSALAAEMKRFAKTHEGSFYAIDRRQEPFPEPSKPSPEAPLEPPPPPPA